MKRSIAAFLIVIATASVASAGGTDRENFQKFIGKFAPQLVSKSKTACICWEVSFHHRGGRVRHWVHDDQIELACLVPKFDAAGE